MLALLCFVPFTIVGVPTDLFWWEWLTIVPVGTLFLGLPQFMMFLVALNTKKRFTRSWSLVISCIALATFFALQLDIDAASSSTASLSYFFLQVLILPFAAAAIGVVVLLSPADS
ncbi:hypothetical protein N8940_01215 [Sphingomonadaceae bacterium]|nr:hypothetical protein [Sphingomonadaceae bacterium]